MNLFCTCGLLALQSLSKQSDLETVVKTLAPALLAELAKMKSSPSTSSSSRSASPESVKGRPSTEKTKVTSHDAFFHEWTVLDNL